MSNLNACFFIGSVGGVHAEVLKKRGAELDFESLRMQMVGNRGIDGEWVIWRMGLMGLDVASGDRGSAKKRLMEGEGWIFVEVEILEEE